MFGIRILYRTISLLISAAIVYLIVCAVQVDTASRGVISPSRAQHAAAIVVTGTPGTSQMSADFRAKLRVATSLYSRRLASLLIVGFPSGVNSSSGLSEQRVREIAPIVNPRDVTAILAKTSGSEFSRVEKRIGRGRRVIVVTDAINALYMEGLVADDGLRPEVIAPPASKKSVFGQFSPLFREATGVAVGRVIGFANATWASN